MGDKLLLGIAVVLFGFVLVQSLTTNQWPDQYEAWKLAGSSLMSAIAGVCLVAGVVRGKP